MFSCISQEFEFADNLGLEVAVQGCQDYLAVCTLAYELSGLDSNLDPTVNCHPEISQTGRGINVYAILRKDIKQEDPSIRIGYWWMLKIPWCPLKRVGELLPAH